ncbi:MAG: NAD(P)/FAD-dependent oxidoreductase, partial [Actinomycetota bacterium]
MCVVGGGITGVTTALLLAESGADVVLLEGLRLGMGTTGFTTAKVTVLHGLVYTDLIDQLGPERASMYAAANQAGLDRIASLADGIDCDLQRIPAITYTESNDATTQIDKEVEAARKAGIAAERVTDSPLPFDVAAAVRVDDQVLFHPRRYLVGLGERLSQRGGRIFENSRALRVEALDGRHLVVADSGEIEAEWVVITSLLPFHDPGGYFARTQPSRSYAIAVAGGGVDAMCYGIDEPMRSVRPHPVEEETLLIVEGEAHDVGRDEDTARHYTALEKWARERLDASDVRWKWSAQDYITPDHVPYIGPMNESDETTLVATGFNKWGMTNGTAAAIMLSGIVAGGENPWLECFDSRRLG